MVNIMGLARKNRYALLRYTSIFIGLFNAFLVPFVLNLTFKELDFSFMLVLYGYSLYLNFLDFGFTKPLYSLIRNNKVNSNNYNNILKGSLFIYTMVFILQILLFFTFAVLLWYHKNLELTLAFIALFSLNAVLTSVFGYFKSLFWAINEFEFIEKIEILQRIFNTVSFITLFLTKAPILSFTIANFFALVLMFWILKKIIGNHFKSIKELFASWKTESIILAGKLKKDSFNNFIFSINETLVYNSGFIIFPLFLLSSDLIIFGLWVRLFSGIALFMRAISDIKIHDITSSFFSGAGDLTKTILNRNIVVSLILVTSGFLFYLGLKSILFKFWVDEKYSFSSMLDISLLIMLIGNAFQHNSGTFISAIGGYFHLLKGYSFVLMLVIISSQIIIIMLTRNLGILLLATSIVYFIGSIFYFSKMKKITQNVGI